MSDTTVTLVFSVSPQGKVGFSQGLVAGDGAHVDDKGNVTVHGGHSADLVFQLDEPSRQGWGITVVAFKDRDTGKWDGEGGKPALTADEAADLGFNGSGLNRVTGQLQFDADDRVPSVTVSDANRKQAKFNYRLTVATPSGGAVGQFDPMVENEGIGMGLRQR